jgi:hypothetical protein
MVTTVMEYATFLPLILNAITDSHHANFVALLQESNSS